MARRKARHRAGLLPDGKVLAAVLAVSVVAGIAFAALSSRAVAPAAAPGSAAACDGDEPLRVTADPAVAPTLSALAGGFATMVAEADRPCVGIEVRVMASRDVVAALRAGWDTEIGGQPPDVWVPDSSVWIDVLRNEGGDEGILPGEAAPLARSPLVFAMPGPMADALPDLTIKWRDLLSLPDLEDGWAAYDQPAWGTPRLAVADPLRSTSGLLTLLSLGVAQDQIWAGGSADEAIGIDSDIGVLRFRRAVDTVAPDAGAQLRAYFEADDPLLELSGIPLLEREMWLFNRGQMALPPASSGDGATSPPAPMGGQPAVMLKAIYPTEGAYGADYPFVVLDGDWMDDTSVQAAERFGDYLRSDAGQQRFETAGFRGADNSSNPVHRTEDGLWRQLGGYVLAPPDHPRS
ncbi:MAG TPA: substrate-binding domain-containing protein [Euzebyales bacterium]|nr:substrate-binding domain-containing protein [Euzebyales bacterium]